MFFFSAERFRTMDSFLTCLSKLCSFRHYDRIEVSKMKEKMSNFVCRILSEYSNGFSARNFHQVVQNSLQSVPKNFSMGSFFFFEEHSFVILLFERTFTGTRGRKHQAGLLDLHSSCQDEHAERILLHRKFIFFLELAKFFSKPWRSS